MAKTGCINNHTMWNGDGKPELWIFRINFIKEYEKKHPDVILSEDGYVPQMFDLTYGVYKEYFNGWYCDECKSVVVFTEHFRYDYVPMEKLPEYTYDQTKDWEDYIILRDNDFDDFMDFYKGKKPYEAIEAYDFRYRYKLSADEKTVLAFDKDRKLCFAYELKRFIDFEKQEKEESEKDGNQEFDIEKYCDMARQTALQILNRELDYSRGSIHLLDEIVGKVRGMYRKKMIDDTVLWNLSVVLGTYYGEVLLRNFLAKQGLFWDRSENPPALSNKEKSTMIKPIDTVHSAMFVNEESAADFLWTDCGNIRLLIDLYPLEDPAAGNSK